jgi:hypothetical protein
MLEIRGNMGQCKSKDPDFKSYANAVFRRGCCCLSASLSTKTLRENMGQCKSEGQDFKIMTITIQLNCLQSLGRI